MKDELTECPCIHICSQIGVETSHWCRFRESELPPTGTWRFDPKEHWCPPGVRATVMMLATMMAQGGDDGVVAAMLEQVRTWTREARAESQTYRPEGRED